MIAALRLAVCILATAAGATTPSAPSPDDAVVDERPAAADASAATLIDGAADEDHRASEVHAGETAPDDRATTTQHAPATDDRRAAVAHEAPPRTDERPARMQPDAAPAATPAAVPAETAPTTTAPEGVRFSGIPALNYIADNGLGLGLIAAAYLHDGLTLPYRTAVTVQIFATTNLVQDHALTVDALRVLDLPLRINARVGFLASLTQNYCGVGGSLSCDRTIATDAADAAGLVDDADDDDDEWDRFVRRYYQRRLIVPYGLVNLRYAVVERSAHQPMRVELTAGYRASYYASGNPFADDDGDGAPDMTPWPGSLYAADHPDGEVGLAAIAQVGVMLDSRDREPSPTRGWWMEASARATTPGLSTWNFGGFHATVRGFDALDVPGALWGNRRLVLAHRLTVDGIVGDAPVQELARLGGSQEVYAFGGADAGRGIRVQRFLGALKVVDQTELRWRFAEVQALAQEFAFTAVAFVDVGLVGDRLVAPRNLGTSAGGGGALRVAWNENFVVRLDLATSPVENWALQTYLTINHPF
jgi:hypothetical protein